MKVEKVIQTYKDGVLTHSKQLEVPLPINPETDKAQKPPKYHKVLDLSDAASLALRQAADSQDALVAEIRKLRKQLIRTESQVKARTREREALKLGLQRKTDKLRHLEERNDDLNAKLSAIHDDYNYLEEEAGKLRNALRRTALHQNSKNQAAREQSPSQKTTTTQPATSSPVPTKAPSTKTPPSTKAPSAEEAEFLLAETTRAIAAKPIKK